VQLGDLKLIWTVSRFRKSLTTERVGLAKLGNGTNALVSWSYTVALQVESTIHDRVEHDTNAVVSAKE
jgi:hypothetical protein